MNIPLVSIVTTSFNGARFIADTIESVIIQNYPHKEYLIVDDASQDETSKIIQSYAKQYPWIHLIRNTHNQERSASRNKAIHLAKGKYIAFIDDDDIRASKDKLTQQVTFLEQNHDHSLVGTAVQVINEKGGKTDTFIMIRTGNDIIKNQLLKSNQFIFSTIMARKSALLEAGGFIKEHNLAEDYELRLKMGIHHKLSNLPEPLTYYRDRSDNTSNKNLLKLNLRSLKVAFSFRNDYPNPWRSLFSRLLAFFIPRKRYAWKAKRETQKNKKLAS